MTIARSSQIDLSSTSYYHCMARCVRRSFLCGLDFETGRDYSHRKSWIVSRIKYLASVFAIKICAYAVMSNHYHLVLYVDSSAINHWGDDEVHARWSQIYRQDAQLLSMYSAKEAEHKLALWRQRLGDISWFMRCLNEPIARHANKEDAKKGRFWEGRFKSQALLDEGAVLSAMVYVDLNPVRAKVAQTPEMSDFTSIQERIKKLSMELENKEFDKSLEKQCDETKQPADLMAFANGGKSSKAKIDFHLSDYLELIDTTSRVIREGKRGAVPEKIAPILTRLYLNPQTWFNMIKCLQSGFSSAVGKASALLAFSMKSGAKIPKRIFFSKQSYLATA
ncbi:hypothetical protein [Candidatus Berkiella aquae]|uniref:Transposase IS200-like domain-containing protein n=2 Tax=Candidatus Berkiella aquae TaxID=295108 RepID=A0AAE3LA87_9GAMM|nr:hypothetical protein [Candidatus Berkiella aquae]MCS5711679.1 hypothetical protein [Candidatus Berkiella aquae]